MTQNSHQKEISNMKSIRIALALASAAHRNRRAGADRRPEILRPAQIAHRHLGREELPKASPSQVTFRDTAGGSALMSEIHGHGPENMISMIHSTGRTACCSLTIAAPATSRACRQRFARRQDHHLRLLRRHQSRQSRRRPHAARGHRHARRQSPHRRLDLQPTTAKQMKEFFDLQRK